MGWGARLRSKAVASVSQRSSTLSLWQYVHVYTHQSFTNSFFASCIYSNIQEMRARHKDAFLKKHNLKLGFMSAFVKASAFALQEQPVVNAGKFPEASVEKTTDLLPHLGVTKAFYSQSMET